MERIMTKEMVLAVGGGIKEWPLTWKGKAAVMMKMAGK
jgi:hypothetical protein